MLGRLSAVGKTLWSSSSPRFFSTVPHNLQHFHKTNLNQYCKQIPAFPTLLTKLQLKGQFLEKKPVSYSMDLFLTQKISNPHFLNYVPTQLMSQTLPAAQTTASACENATQLKESLDHKLPSAFKRLSNKLAFYLLLLVDVFNNKLAQRHYEPGVPDQENVSERLHGLQAAKLATLFGLPRDLILAMLFHDLARPTHEDATHGHSNHHLEGDHILAPLGLSLSYTGYHAYAKFLLRELCPPYQDLLSPVSALSLSVQNKKMESQLSKLNQLDSLSLAKNIYQLMFLRLFDDLSKVPALALDKKVQYLTDSAISRMLFDQLSAHLNELAKSGKDLHQVVVTMEDQLEVAMDLLLRPKEYSNNPQLYKHFWQLIEPQPGWRW